MSERATFVENQPKRLFACLSEGVSVCGGGGGGGSELSRPF